MKGRTVKLIMTNAVRTHARTTATVRTESTDIIAPVSMGSVELIVKRILMIVLAILATTEEHAGTHSTASRVSALPPSRGQGVRSTEMTVLLICVCMEPASTVSMISRVSVILGSQDACVSVRLICACTILVSMAGYARKQKPDTR